MATGTITKIPILKKNTVSASIGDNGNYKIGVINDSRTFVAVIPHADGYAGTFFYNSSYGYYANVWKSNGTSLVKQTSITITIDIIYYE